MDQNSIKQELITSSSSDLEIDTYSILSLSVYYDEAIYINKDYRIFAKGDNTKNRIDKSLPNQELEKFTEYEIKDEKGCIYFPISAQYLGTSILYMISEVKKGFKTKLAYHYKEKDPSIVFLNIGDSNPVAIYGGDENYAAIDMEGAIIYIPICVDTDEKIEPQHLPNNEKAVKLACGINDFLALSSSGKLFISKATKAKLNFKQVKELSKTKVVSISGYSYHFLALTEEGKVFSYGYNSSGQLGIGSKKVNIYKFMEIVSLRQYQIKDVYTNFDCSFFQTKTGQILACGGSDINELVDQGYEYNEVYIPIETKIKNGAEFCITSFSGVCFSIGFDIEKSPNRRVSDDIIIALFGGKGKTKILHSFINNNFNETNLNKNDDEYKLNIEINQSIIKLILFDSSNYDESFDMRIKYYQLAPYFLFFFDISTQSPFDELDILFKEAEEVWGKKFKCAIVAYGGVFSKSENSKELKSKSKYNDIRKKYNCEVFEVISKDLSSINEPFYYFLKEKKIVKKQNEIIKIGKEHRDPFINIKTNRTNIGLFGSNNVNKTELCFKFVYEEFYEHYYEEFTTKFSDIELTKVIEVCNKFVSLSVIDSTFVNNIEEEYYSAVQGIIFVFSIDILSTTNYINEIKLYYDKAAESVKKKLIFIIALQINEDQQDQIINEDQVMNSKIDEIEKKFKSEVFLFSMKTCENIQKMFYYLTKKIIQNKRTAKKSSLKKKKRHP